MGSFQPLQLFLLFLAGAAASAVNAVAGGGTLITFPLMTIGMHMDLKIANATNSVSLWPGSLSGAFGFKNLLHKTGHYLKTLFIPTALGSAAGALLFMNTSKHGFQIAVPFLILMADILLFLQPKVKKFAAAHGEHHTSLWFGAVMQFFVAVYGGYFGAGMGIMMLAAFALYIEGTIHELNAVKNWLGVIINFVCSLVFISQGLIAVVPAIALTSGSVLGGFSAAKLSQRVNPDKLRLCIAFYGLFMVAYFAYEAWKG